MAITTGTALAIGAGVSALSAGIAGVAAYQQGQAQGEIAQQRADSLRASSNLKEFQDRKRNKAFRSKQRAAIGKSGLELTGTPESLLEMTAAEQEKDILINRYNTELGMFDLKAEGAVAESQGRNEALSQFLTIPTILTDARVKGG